MNINFEGTIRTNKKGLSYLITFYNKLKDLRKKEIIIDFYKLKEFDINLLAILGCMLDKLKEQDNKIYFVNIGSKYQNLFKESYFLKPTYSRDTKRTTIPFFRFENWDENLFSNYVDKLLLSRDELPSMSPDFKKLIRRNIQELFINVKEHGCCKYVYACGQVYTHYYPKINFTIVDLGKTIKSNVCYYTAKNYTGIEAIEWAIQEGNSTADLEDEIFRGVGLSYLLEFIQSNKGKFQIISADGFWESNQKDKNNFLQHFPGTVVNIIINLKDENKYL